MTEIATNISRLREEIHDAANKSGRHGSDICLVAATKTQSAATIQAAIQAGIDTCGENKVQELTEKKAENAYAGAACHFIGHLQKNKIRKVVGAVDVIQSVDSIALLQGINRVAEELKICQNVLIQVNIGNDFDKFGIDATALDILLKQAECLENTRIQGLMTILPLAAEEQETYALYQRLHQIYVDISAKTYHNTSMEILSMGMSGDFMQAIAAGANMVRIGSTIFGARTYPTK